jgi:hypothetical protein
MVQDKEGKNRVIKWSGKDFAEDVEVSVRGLAVL